MEYQHNFNNARCNIDIKANDQQKLKELLEESGIYTGKDTVQLFQRARITYFDLLHSIQIHDQGYLSTMQNLWQLSNEEMAMLSFNVMKRLKAAQHSLNIPDELNPNFYGASRAGMPPMQLAPNGYPMPFYRDPNMDPNMSHMLYDNLTMEQPQPYPHMMPIPYGNYPYYIEQMNHNTTVYNNHQRDARNAGKLSAQSRSTAKKSTGTKTNLKSEIEEGSHTMDTKDQTRSKEKTATMENSTPTSISDMVKELVEISPYYLQDAENIEDNPLAQELLGVQSKKQNKRRREEKNILNKAYGILAPKNPRQLNHAKILTKGRVTKYGNYRDTQLISYDDRVDTPSCAEDIFYPGRGFRTKDDLHEAIQAYKRFGYSMIIEKSEVKRGRYTLSWNQNSKKKKSIFGSDEDEEKEKKEPWKSYVYIYKLKVKNLYLKHSHKPEKTSDPSDKAISIIYRKEKEDPAEKKPDSIKEEYQLDL